MLAIGGFPKKNSLENTQMDTTFGVNLIPFCASKSLEMLSDLKWQFLTQIYQYMKSLSDAHYCMYVCPLFTELSKDKDTHDCRDDLLEDRELKCKYK